MKNVFSSLKINVLMLSVSLFLAAAMTTLSSCGAAFDAVGSQNVSSLATQLPALMGKATEAYSKHEQDVTKILSDISNAAAHAATLKKNKEVAEAWKILQNDLVTPFFSRWKEKGKLDKDFVKEATMQVTKSLEAIKKSEAAKRR